MEWLSLLLAAVLFAAACNLDTVILSMGYAVKGVRVSLSHSLIIAALTTLITWASLLLGAGAARVLSGPLPNLLGGLVLVVAMAALQEPLRGLVRLLGRTGVGLAVLWLFGRVGGLIGVTLGVNLFNALVLGVLGAPGFGLLLMLSWALR